MLCLLTNRHHSHLGNQTPAVAILSSLALVVNFAFFRLSKQYNLFNKNKWERMLWNCWNINKYALCCNTKHNNTRRHSKIRCWLSYGAWHGKDELIIPSSIKLINDEALNECAVILTIRYLGTVAKWEQITKIGSCIPNVTTIQCTDGSTVFKN